MSTAAPACYRDQQAWRDLQQLLPADLRLADVTAPEGEFWDWRNKGLQGCAGLQHATAWAARVNDQMALSIGAAQEGQVVGADLASQFADPFVHRLDVALQRADLLVELVLG